MTSIGYYFLYITEADDYVTNLSENASLRVMILSRVVVGRPDKRYRNAPSLTAPAPGYDSVCGVMPCTTIYLTFLIGRRRNWAGLEL